MTMFGPVLINSSGSYSVQNAGHCLVRKDSTTLYCVATAINGGEIAVFKSANNGVSWSKVGSLLVFIGVNVAAASACIDADGNIRIVYIYSDAEMLPATFVDLRYAAFDTASNTFPTAHSLAQSMHVNSAYYYTDCAIADDRLHAVYPNFVNFRGTPRYFVYYTNYDGSSWQSGFNVASSLLTEGRYGYISIEGQSRKLPLVSIINPGTTNRVIVARGTSENPVAAFGFEGKTFTSSFPYVSGSVANGPALIQDALGNYYAVFIGNTTSASFARNVVWSKLAAGGNWSTGWQLEQDIDDAFTTYNNAGLTSHGYGRGVGDINIYAGKADVVPDVVRRWHNYNKFQGNTWTGPQNIGSFRSPIYVKPRFANYWEPALHAVSEFVVQAPDIEANTNLYYFRQHLDIPV